MAKVARKKSASKAPARAPQRVSPMKPGISGARNWATAQVRAATYTRKAFMRLTLSILFIFLAVLYGALWLGGYLPNAKDAVSDFSRAQLVSMGFVVKRVDVMGEGRLRESEVRETLGVNAGDFLFDLDTRSAQNRIQSLSWVDHAVVRRLWPNRVVVQIVERRPYALWQYEGAIKVVDLKGLPIEDADYTQYFDLPLIVGKDAAPAMETLQAHLRSFPNIAQHVEAIVKVNDRQWNLKMFDGTLSVQLPHDDILDALSKLNSLQNDQQILSRQISNIDLRLADRITLTPLASQRA